MSSIACILIYNNELKIGGTARILVSRDAVIDHAVVVAGVDGPPSTVSGASSNLSRLQCMRDVNPFFPSVPHCLASLPRRRQRA